MSTQDTPPGSTPPGWYPDEIDTLRWFDGRRWTDATRPVGSDLRAAYAAGPGATGPPPPSRPRQLRRRLVLAALAVVLLAGIVVVVLGATRSSDGPAPAAGPTTPLTTTAPSTAPPSSPPAKVGPTTPPTSPPTSRAPRRSRAVRASPVSVARALYAAVNRGDCRTVKRLVTPALLRVGRCRPAPRGAKVRVVVGRPRVKGATAVLTVTQIARIGEGAPTTTRSLVELKRVERGWLVTSFSVRKRPRTGG